MFMFFSQGLYIHVKACAVVCVGVGMQPIVQETFHGAMARVCDSVCLKYSCAFSKLCNFSVL